MTAPLSLARRLDLPAAAPLREAILARQGADLVLDAGAVTHFGGLCLQVLLAARRSWQADGHGLACTPRSAAFDEAVAHFGLTPDDLQTGRTT
jgi:chemotaxis protein CheX